MHVAAALNVPTVGLFGPTSGTMYRPYSENSVVVQKDIQCPYRVPNHEVQRKGQLCYAQGRCIAGPISCIDKITVDDVFLAIQQLCSGFPYERKLSSISDCVSQS